MKLIKSFDSPDSRAASLRKYAPPFLALLLVLLCALFFLPFLRSRARQTTDEAFETFTEELFLSSVSENTLTLHYMLADPQAAGISDAPVTFGEYSADAKKRSAASLENALNKLSAFSPEELSAKNRLTYDILTVQMERELKLLAYPCYEEIFSPLLGTQAQLPVLLAEYAFYSKTDIDTYLSLLGQLDVYYEKLLDYQRERSDAGLFMSDETADAVIAQCRDFLSDPGNHFLLTSFEERLAEAHFLSEEERKAYTARNRTLVIGHVLPAYELLRKGIEELKGSGLNPYGLCHYPEGTAYYEALVACTVGSDRSIPQIKELINRQMSSDAQAMAEVIKKRPELLTGLSRSAPEQTPEAILASLKEQVERDFPSISDSACQVKYVAPSLEEHLSPAFYLTPPLDRTDPDSHIIYINSSADYDSLSLFTTLAHEGYPGHLYQTVYENSLCLNPARNLFYFGGYVEGWATYAELYSYRLTALDSDSTKLLASNSFLLLGLYARADIGVHYDGWTPEQLMDYFGSYGIRNESTLRSIYQAIVQDPGNYLKYYLGAAEILSLKSEAEEALGEQFTLKEFHTFLLSMGPAPFSVIREYLQDWTGAD